MAFLSNPRVTLAAGLCIAALASSIPAHGASPREGLVGTWRGTSKCVDKQAFPACNDEIIVYRASRLPEKDTAVLVAADKVVDGKPALMGEFEFAFDAKLGAWLSEFSNGRVHGRWTLRVDGARLEGTLLDVPTHALVRKIEATKDGPAS